MRRCLPFRHQYQPQATRRVEYFDQSGRLWWRWRKVKRCVLCGHEREYGRLLREPA